MKLIDIVRQLQREGHSVEYRVRSDGGIIITRINDTKFKRITEGNRLAREMTGAALSPARAVQTHANIIKFIKGHKKPTGKVSDELKKELRKVQRLWRKNKIGGTARVTIRKLRWRLENEGLKSAKSYLKNMAKYVEGIANESSVYEIVYRIQRLQIQFPSMQNELDELINILMIKKETFKEDWVHPSLEIIYSIEETIIEIQDGIVKLRQMWKQ